MKTLNPEDKIARHLMDEYLQEMNPEIHRTCIEAVKPLLTDIKHIPAIFKYINDNQAGVLDNENRTFYLAIYYRIFSPVHLYTTEVKLKPGIRPLFSEILSMSHPEEVSRYQRYLLPHFKNPRWAAQVNELAFEIVENIKSELAECQ